MFLYVCMHASKLAGTFFFLSGKKFFAEECLNKTIGVSRGKLQIWGIFGPNFKCSFCIYVMCSLDEVAVVIL